MKLLTKLTGLLIISALLSGWSNAAKSTFNRVYVQNQYYEQSLLFPHSKLIKKQIVRLYSPDQFSSQRTIIANEQGQITNIITEDKSIKEPVVITHLYDYQNNQFEILKNNEYIDKAQITLNNEGNITVIQSKDNSGKIITKKFNYKDGKIENVHWNIVLDLTEIDSRTTEYIWKDDLIVKYTITDNNGTKITENTFFYDNEGRIEKITSIEQNNKELKHTLTIMFDKYNEFGDWTESTTSITLDGHRPLGPMIHKREIEYFN